MVRHHRLFYGWEFGEWFLCEFSSLLWQVAVSTVRLLVIGGENSKMVKKLTLRLREYLNSDYRVYESTTM